MHIQNFQFMIDSFSKFYSSLDTIGKKSLLKVFGCDYPTLDETGMPDFIHAQDEACRNVAPNNHIKNDIC
jgi:UDP-glucose 4-epimerase